MKPTRLFESARLRVPTLALIFVGNGTLLAPAPAAGCIAVFNGKQFQRPQSARVAAAESVLHQPENDRFELVRLQPAVALEPPHDRG